MTLLYSYSSKIYVQFCKPKSWHCTFQPTENGGECQAGYYCPLGAWSQIDCTASWYCNTTGLSSPVALCDPGWYCPPISSGPRQVVCPRGYYCPEGTDLPNPCRNGTYGHTNNLAASTECLDCEPGYYCNETAAIAVSGPCTQGEFTKATAITVCGPYY